MNQPPTRRDEAPNTQYPTPNTLSYNSQLSTLNSQLESYELAYLLQIVSRVNDLFQDDSWRWRMAKYRSNPKAFAAETLGSDWWFKQKEVAEYVVKHRRIIVKSANGVGKTFLAADIALWFLYSYHPAIVLTLAPTWRQVRHVLWQEIRRRHRRANTQRISVNANQYSRHPVTVVSARATRPSAWRSPCHPVTSSPAHLLTCSRAQPLPGTLLTTRLDLPDGAFALGLATDTAVNIQGFHAENLLIIFDEASGIPDEIWDTAEGIAVGSNNKILAIGNPLCASGRFYRNFTRPGAWKRITINGLKHPNINRKYRRTIPGCITPDFIQEKIQDWCDPIEPAPPGLGAVAPSFSSLGSLKSLPSGRPTPNTQHPTPVPDCITWRHNFYRPNNLFRARILGEFPTADDDTLIPHRWIEKSVNRGLPKTGFIRAAVDVARFGNDNTVIALRDGPVVIDIKVEHGADTMEVAGHIRRLAYDVHPESITIDAIGIGAGVVDRLFEEKVEGIEPVNVSHQARDPEQFANRRAELYWGLRERFRLGEIDIPDDDALMEELSCLRYRFTSRGQIRMESKAEMKKRLGRSPDRADALALLYDGSGDALFRQPVPQYLPPSRAAQLRQEMRSW